MHAALVPSPTPKVVGKKSFFFACCLGTPSFPRPAPACLSDPRAVCTVRLAHAPMEPQPWQFLWASATLPLTRRCGGAQRLLERRSTFIPFGKPNQKDDSTPHFPHVQTAAERVGLHVSRGGCTNCNCCVLLSCTDMTEPPTSNSIRCFKPSLRTSLFYSRCLAGSGPIHPLPLPPLPILLSRRARTSATLSQSMR